jgi:hypothetical protein
LYRYDALAYIGAIDDHFTITAIVSDDVIETWVDGDFGFHVSYKVTEARIHNGGDGFELDYLTYIQYSEGLVDDVYSGVQVELGVTDGALMVYTTDFSDYVDPFDIETYQGLDGGGTVLGDGNTFSMEILSANLRAVPGGGALPLAGLGAIAIRRRRRRR